MASILHVPSVAEMQSLVRLYRADEEKFHEAFMLRRVIQDCYGLSAAEVWALKPEELYDMAMQLAEASLDRASA